jgi:hypothetical protein
MESAGALETILQAAPAWVWLALSASGIAGAVSAFLASTHKNVFLQFLADTLNIIGMNIWKAKNGDDTR